MSIQVSSQPITNFSTSLELEDGLLKRELQSEAERLGLPYSGTKKEIAKRLLPFTEKRTYQRRLSKMFCLAHGITPVRTDLSSADRKYYRRKGAFPPYKRNGRR